MLQCINCFNTEVNLQGRCAVCGDVMAPVTHQRHEQADVLIRESSACIEVLNRILGN